jgi:hypothetical protein
MRGLPLLGAEDHRMDVAAWLQSLGLERYVPAFRNNEIDWDALPKLTAEDLKDLGVVLGGHAVSSLRPSPHLALRCPPSRRLRHPAMPRRKPMPNAGS